MLELPLFVRDRLRTGPGAKAFLAIDIDIPLDEMAAGTQSIEFALARNSIVYIVPKLVIPSVSGSRLDPSVKPSIVNKRRVEIALSSTAITNGCCSFTSLAFGAP